MRRPLPALFFTLAIAACGGKLADDESVSTVVPGDVTRDSGASSTTTDIARLPGLVLWLESTKGVLVESGHVRNWIDQSPEHNDLALFEGNGATVTSSIGGAQTVAFDGASSYSLPFDTPLDDWSGDFLVEIVLRAKSTNSLQAIFSCSGAPPHVPGFTRATFYLDTDQTSECSVDSDGYSNESQTKSLGGDAVLLAYYRHGNTLEARRNSSVDRSDTVSQATSPSCAKTIFGAELTEDLASQDDYLASEIAEIVVVHGHVDARTVGDVETSLETKYLIH